MKKFFTPHIFLPRTSTRFELFSGKPLPRGRHRVWVCRSETAPLAGANKKLGGSMYSVRNWIGVGAAALIAGALTFATTAGFAMPRYDGLWSVST